jgi:hypothetical protein
MTCYCCKRMNRETCLCNGPTCRTCLRCESHCQCIHKPKGPTCAKPGKTPPVGQRTPATSA